MRRSLALAFLALVTGSTVRCVDFAWGCEGTRTCPAESSGGGATESMSTGGSTTSTSTTSTGSFIEDCLDGADDDGDGHTDCEDSDCSSDFECVDPISDELWNHVLIFRNNYSNIDPPPNCPDGSSPITYFVGPGEPIRCNSCKCELIGTECSAPTIACSFYSMTCDTLPSLVFSTDTDKYCLKDPFVPPMSATSACQITESAHITNPGLCSSSPSDETVIIPPKWGEAVYVCAQRHTGGGCIGGQVCIHKGNSNYDTTCIAAEDVQTCPSSWSNVPIEAYEDGVDTRGCEECTCTINNETAKCTGGGYEIFDGDSCSAKAITITNSDECVRVDQYLDGNTGSLRSIAAHPTIETCPGSTPTGSVTPGKAHTLCCK